MQPAPIKIKKVTTYQYFNPLEPLSEPVLTDDTASFSLVTLGLSLFYSPTIDNGEKVINPSNIPGKHNETLETESEDIYTKPWLYCLENSANPELGGTIRMLLPDRTDTGVNLVNESRFIILGKLTNITVYQIIKTLNIEQRTLITNGTGSIIVTKLGTPHKIGVQVDTGDWLDTILDGSKNIIISGRTKKGDTFYQTGYTTVTGGKPEVFLKEFCQ